MLVRERIISSGPDVPDVVEPKDREERVMKRMFEEYPFPAYGSIPTDVEKRAREHEGAVNPHDSYRTLDPSGIPPKIPPVLFSPSTLGNAMQLPLTGSQRSPLAPASWTRFSTVSSDVMTPTGGSMPWVTRSLRNSSNMDVRQSSGDADLEIQELKRAMAGTRDSNSSSRDSGSRFTELFSEREEINISDGQMKPRTDSGIVFDMDSRQERP